MNNSNYTKENLKKNKPTIIIPIMNTIFAIILLALCIRLKVVNKEAFKLVYFIGALILIVIYPVGSWYTSYFSKKNNTKRIKNYEKETNEIVSYIKRLKNYRSVEINRDKKLNVYINYGNNNITKSVEYDDEHFSFGLPKEDSVILTLGVSFAGLEFKGYNKEFMGLCGVMPKSIWFMKHLKAPIAKKGTIRLEAINFQLTDRLIIQALKNQDTFYDKKSGWLVIGERKSTALDENVELMDKVILVVRNNEIVALWIYVGPNCAI